MARTLKAPGPLDTLEEAFDLLQQTPASVWLRYLAGAVPLLLGLLFAWNQFSGALGQNDNSAAASLLLVALLVWFYRCREIFAANLRGLLSLERESASPAKRSFSLTCFEATKLLVIPLAALTLLPFAAVTAFYRNLALFAGEGRSTRDAIAAAWKAATVWQRENWFAIAILNLFGLIVFINVAITVVVAPMLIRMFTGYESVFTERGAQTLFIQFPIIVALTWLCFDPLLQAFYTVRCFAWEGLRTGEDLLVRLRRLAPMLALLFAFVGSAVAQQPAPGALSQSDALNQSIDKTLQSHDYNWRFPPATETEKHDWFIDNVDRAVAQFQKGWHYVVSYAGLAMDWLMDQFRDKMPAQDKSKPGKPGAVRPAFYGFGLAIVAIALAVLWKFRSRSKPAALGVPTAVSGPDLTDESLLASDLPEDEWLRLAERYAASGDLRLALRALYLGTLALLASQRLLTVHACKSNRDYEGEVRRRSRSADLLAAFRQNIRSFERSWYGFHDVTAAQLQTYRENLSRLRSAS